MPGVEKAVAATLSNFQEELQSYSLYRKVGQGLPADLSGCWLYLRAACILLGTSSHLLHCTPGRQGFEDPSHPFCGPQRLGLPQLSSSETGFDVSYYSKDRE